MPVPRSRILDLLKVQCRIFSMTYNPERLRTGNKIIRQRLKGPSVVDYYPKKGPSLRDLRNAFPGLDTWDDDEEDRLEGLTLARVRGKGAPKKKRTAEESKQFAKGKKKPSPAIPKAAKL